MSSQATLFRRLPIAQPCNLFVPVAPVAPLRRERGYWMPSDVPGLGIEVDEKAAARHPFQQEVIHATTVRAYDGAVPDW